MESTWEMAYDPYYGQPDLAGGVNTLFVSGLPDDVKAREIHNLFRRRPGFDSCQLKYTGRANQVVAFATFLNHESALAALHSLDGVKFDPQSGSALRVELARTNSRRKRNRDSGPYVVIDNRSKEDNNAQENSSNDGESEPDARSDSEHQESEDKEDGVFDAPKSTETETDKAVDSTNQQEGNQCSTLFIANLGPGCTEDELMQILSQYPGFNVLKLHGRFGVPVAFADFEEIEQANRAMEDLNGTTLPSSERGGIQIEFARSKMRKS